MSVSNLIEILQRRTERSSLLGILQIGRDKESCSEEDRSFEQEDNDLLNARG